MSKLFGTDGIRGEANRYPLTPDNICRLGQAGATVMSHFNRGRDRTIVIGRDTRRSGDMIEGALVSGICSAGLDVLKLGIVTTPALSYITKELGSVGGIMISASHNPFYDNGIKFFDHEGKKIPEELEARIEEMFFARTQNTAFKGTRIGRVRSGHRFKQLYINFVKKILLPGHNRPLKLIFDCAQGATFRIAPEIFRNCGHQVKFMFTTPNGVNINQNCGSTHILTSLKDTVIKEKADLGLAFDGDGDRVLAVTATGELLDGDHIIAICSRYMENIKEHPVVGTVMSNLGLEKFLASLDIEFIRSPVGDRWVYEEMVRSGSLLGGEPSGHVIFRNYLNSGDGIITAVNFINTILTNHLNISDISGIIKKYPQIMINLKMNRKLIPGRLKSCRSRLAELENKFGRNGRILIRESGTEPLIRIMAEGENEKLVKQIAMTARNILSADNKTIEGDDI